MARPRLLLAVQVVAVTAILACVVALAALHPARLDLTPERRFTLSPHSREVLARLTGDVRITVFYSSQAGALRREMADLLALYQEARPAVTVRFLDLDRSPGMAKRLGVGTYNTAVIEAGERRERVELVNEESVTAALLAVAGTPPVTVYFLVGHGEHDPRDTDERGGASEAARALVSEGFQVRALEGAAHVPEDAGVVAIAGATRDLRPAEVDALDAWLRAGGSALVLADPGAPSTVRHLLAGFGVELAGDLVVDERGRLFGTDGLSARVAHLNQGLVPRASEIRALLPEAQSVRLTETADARADYLAMTSEDTWADVDRRGLEGGVPVFRPGRDRSGPLPIAALARTGGAGGHEGRLLVVGDADFVTNLHVNVLGNRDLLLIGAGLLARAEPLVASRPAVAPGGTFSTLTLSAREARLVFFSVVVAPSLVMASIAAILARRRRLA
jgi:ABC-type uncharacterized transport system involved in gliding motility auxiliary subunit